MIRDILSTDCNKLYLVDYDKKEYQEEKNNKNIVAKAKLLNLIELNKSYITFMKKRKSKLESSNIDNTLNIISLTKEKKYDIRFYSIGGVIATLALLYMAGKLCIIMALFTLLVGYSHINKLNKEIESIISSRNDNDEKIKEIEKIIKKEEEKLVKKEEALNKLISNNTVEIKDISSISLEKYNNIIINNAVMKKLNDESYISEVKAESCQSNRKQRKRVKNDRKSNKRN